MNALQEIQYIEFPEPHFTDSNRRTREAYEASKGKRPQTHITTGACCYRRLDGVLRQCYNPYKPEYPADSAPGFGDVLAVLCWYPNDSYGYEYSVSNFQPLAPA